MLLDALDSNWIAPIGPHVDAFERELADRVGVSHAVALSSGTAALHLALHLLGVSTGDDVLVSTFTFVASASAITYLNARPVFIDCDTATWNMDPALLVEELELRAKRGSLPKAVVVVDLYGQCADYDPIVDVCARFEVPLVEDAAEALGATYRGRPAGSFGEMAVFSFNGNKIITTSGGGMLVSSRGALIERARFLAGQARDPAPHYEHSEVGFNYRLSNLLAAVGSAQLRTLDDRVAKRRANNASYRSALAEVNGISFMPRFAPGDPTYWLTCITVDPVAFGASREAIRVHLESLDIETRPTWKPLHLQPAFAGAGARGGAVSAAIFDRGLCLPSGSRLTIGDIERVVEGVLAARR